MFLSEDLCLAIYFSSFLSQCKCYHTWKGPPKISVGQAIFFLSVSLKFTFHQGKFLSLVSPTFNTHLLHLLWSCPRNCISTTPYWVHSNPFGSASCRKQSSHMPKPLFSGESRPRPSWLITRNINCYLQSPQSVYRDGWMDRNIDGWTDGWMEVWEPIGWMKNVKGHYFCLFPQNSLFLHIVQAQMSKTKMTILFLSIFFLLTFLPKP